jgi:hypothetical protein
MVDPETMEARCTALSEAVKVANGPRSPGAQSHGIVEMAKAFEAYLTAPPPEPEAEPEGGVN